MVLLKAFILNFALDIGTVSDCWEVTERGAAFSILFVGQFFGPLLGKETSEPVLSIVTQRS